MRESRRAFRRNCFRELSPYMPVVANYGNHYQAFGGKSKFNNIGGSVKWNNIIYTILGSATCTACAYNALLLPTLDKQVGFCMRKSFDMNQAEEITSFRNKGVCVGGIL